MPKLDKVSVKSVKPVKKKCSVSAYCWLNFCSWQVLSFASEEQYLWNQSPRSPPFVTRFLDLNSCSWYLPASQVVLCDRCLHPHSGVPAVLREFRICPCKITPPSTYLSSVLPTFWAVLCKKCGGKRKRVLLQVLSEVKCWCWLAMCVVCIFLQRVDGRELCGGQQITFSRSKGLNSAII